MRRLLIYLTILLLSLVSFAQENGGVAAELQVSDSMIDEALEAGSKVAEADSSGYIIASLVIVEPDKESLITYFGHAALRLQCPSAGLDYCFSFDSMTSGSFWALVTGADRTTLLPIATPEFIERYTSQHRKVYEHELNLTLEEEQRLWQMVDKLVDMHDYLQTDFAYHGCAGETASIIASALDGHLQYPTMVSSIDRTHYEIINKYMTPESWNKLMLSIFVSHDTHTELADNEEKLIVPSLLETVWKETRIVGTDGSERSVFAPKDMVVYDASSGMECDSSPWTPSLYCTALLALVLLLCIAELFVGRIRVLSMGVDALLLAVQTVIGLVIVALLLCSTLSSTSGWNSNLVVFNPIPLLVWLYLWRRRPSATVRCRVFALYTVVLAGFLVYMYAESRFFLFPQYLLAATFGVRCAGIAYSNYRNSKRLQ